MRVTFRADAPVAVLAFSTLYVDCNVSAEVARLYTSVDHLRRIVEVLTKNIEIYDNLPSDAAGKKRLPPSH